MNSQGKKSIQQNMIFNTIGSLIYYVCQWLMTILIVRLSGYEDAGMLSVAISVTAAPAIVGLFNVRNFQVSDLKGQYSNCIYIRSRVYTNLLSFIVCIIMVCLGGYNIKKSVVILSFMLFKVAEGFADVYYGIEQKKERMDYAGISLIIRGVGTIVLFAIVIWSTHSLLLSILVISIFSILVIFFYDCRIVKMWNVAEEEKKDYLEKQECKQLDYSENKKVLQLLMACLPLAVVAFLNNLSLNIPKIYLEQYHGSEVMGIYSSVASPTMVVYLAANTIFAPLIPVLTKEFQDRNKKKFFDILKRFGMLMIGLSIICLLGSRLLAHWGLVLLFGKSIEPYVSLFVPIIFVSILIGINASLFSICTLIREIGSQYIIGLCGVLSTWIFSVTLVKSLSMIGVVYALVGTLCIQIIIQIMIICRKVKNYKWKAEDEC